MARRKVSPNESTELVEEFAFTKTQLAKSEKYANYRDALNALLKDDETYTFTQVDEVLEKFYKGGNK